VIWRMFSVDLEGYALSWPYYQCRWTRPQRPFKPSFGCGWGQRWSARTNKLAKAQLCRHGRSAEQSSKRLLRATALWLCGVLF